MITPQYFRGYKVINDTDYFFDGQIYTVGPIVMNWESPPNRGVDIEKELQWKNKVKQYKILNTNNKYTTGVTNNYSDVTNMLDKKWILYWDEYSLLFNKILFLLELDNGQHKQLLNWENYYGKGKWEN
jgi:hypothetical protein